MKTIEEHLTTISDVLNDWNTFLTGPAPGMQEAALESLTAVRKAFTRLQLNRDAWRDATMDTLRSKGVSCPASK